MAHEGYSIDVNVGTASLHKATELTSAFDQAIRKVDSHLKGIHFNQSLPKEINHINTVTASYVDRLESEGKTYEANKQRVKAYQGAVTELTDKQHKLESALSQIAKESGKTSDAYRTQQVRINENAVELNKFKNSIAQTNAAMRRVNPSFGDRIRNKLHSVNSEARKTHRTFREVFAGSFAGNALSNALSTVGSKLGSAVKDGMALNGEIGKANARFKGMGLSSRQISRLDSQMNNLRQRTAMTAGTVTNLQTRTLNWSQIGVRGGMRMTKAIAGIGDSSRMTDAEMQRMAVGIGRVGANGKVTLSSLSRITRSAPTFYSTLAKGAGMSEKHMKSLLASGKVTTAQFQKWMANSSKYANSAFSGYEKTQGGAMKFISERWRTLKGTMTKPLFDAKSSGLQSLKGILTSKELTNGARDIGRGVASAVGYLDKHKKDISASARDIVHIGVTLGKDIWKDFGAIVGDIGRSFGLIHGNASKSASPLHQVRLALDGLAKNQKAIGFVSKAIIAMAAAKGLGHVTSGIGGIADSAMNAYHNVKALRGGFKDINALSLDKMSNNEQLFAHLGSGAHTFGNALKHPITQMHNLVGEFEKMKNAEGGAQVLGGTGAKVWGAAGTALVAGGQTLKAVRDRHSATNRSKDIGGAVGAAAGGIATSFIPVVGPALAPVGAEIGKFFGRYGGQAVDKFTKGWQRNKPPKKFWSLENLGFSTRQTFGRLGKLGGQIGKKLGSAAKNAKPFVKHNWKQIALTMVAPMAGIPALLYKNNPKFRKWANQTGASIHKGWNRAIKTTHRFFKSIPGDLHRFSTKFGKDWNGLWKGANRNRYVSAFKKGRFFKTAVGDMRSRWGSFSKWFGKGWNSTWSAANSNRYVKAFKKGQFFSTALHDIRSRWNSFSKWFGNNWNHFWGGLARTKDKVMNNVKAFGNDIAYGLGFSKHTFKYKKIKGHAAGGAIGTTHTALVGELGPELAYKTGNARLLGANGPQITRVHAGEHILNARDTSKVINGGLGAGLKLRGYAAGTDQPVKTNKNVASSYKKMAKGSSKTLTSFAKSSKNTWHRVSTQTKRETQKTNKQSVKDYTTMRRGVNRQMRQLRSGTVSLAKSTSKGFGKALDRMKGYSRDAMSDTIGQINRGIRGIDKVLSQFGGNSAVIKTVKFANGTNGRLSKPTYAMVNDATMGPRQEAVVKDNGDIWIPHGKNRKTILDAGDAVLNGRQTQELANSWGLEHFAKGSGVSHSQLRKIASRGASNPAGSFNNMYTDNIKSIGDTAIKHGSIDLGKNASNHFGVPWMGAMWDVIEEAIGDGAGKGGTREAFLKYAERTFSGVKYVMGAASKTASDCSGMVMQALRHFGINIGRTTVAMQHSSGVEYLGKSLSNTLPGDLVIYGHGTGAAGHVGIIKNPRAHSMFNETPPSARVSSIDAPKSMGYGYYRVRGLHNASQKKVKKNSALEALAKRELGKSALAWIRKNLSESIDSFSLGGDIGSRARTLAKALRQLDPRATKNGIAAILGNWEFESTLNPAAVNPGGGASGLGQWLGGRLSNLKAYARRHGHSWRDAATQLQFALHGDGSDSSIFKRILEGHGSISSLANAFSSEWERGGYNSQHVAGAMTIRKALGYAEGGDPKVGDTVVVGEHGPELAKFKEPVHVYSNKDSNKLNLSNLLNVPKLKPAGSPTINININGNISSDRDANRYADIISRKLSQLFENLGDEFGTDPSIY